MNEFIFGIIVTVLAVAAFITIFLQVHSITMAEYTEQIQKRCDLTNVIIINDIVYKCKRAEILK